MNNYADLHLHSTFSDGSLSPNLLVKRAAELGFKAIALTDHDCIEGIPSALDAAKQFCIDVIPGVEISTMWKNKEIHILGYYFDVNSPRLIQQLTKFSEERKNRAALIVRKLNGLGIHIALDDVLAIAGQGSVGRPHIAKAMLTSGYVYSIDQAFSNYLQPHCPAYVPRYYLAPEEAIDIIREAKGIPILAHPGLYQIDGLIPSLAKKLDGIEVWHCKHSKKEATHYLALANKFNLIPTGGSDWHGSLTQNRCSLGSIHVDYLYVEKLKEKALQYKYI